MTRVDSDVRLRGIKDKDTERTWIFFLHFLCDVFVVSIVVVDINIGFVICIHNYCCGLQHTFSLISHVLMLDMNDSSC